MESLNNTNTLTLLELEEAFHAVVASNKGKPCEGIKNGKIKLEDSVPWFEVYFKGKGSTKMAKDFCQQLANSMNIAIYFNRMEGESTGYTVFGAMDIDYEAVENGCNNVPALSADPDGAEYLEEFGKRILPVSTKI